MTATLPRPGSIVTTRSSPPPRTVPTDTGAWFVAGLTDRGPLAPVPVTSLSDFVNKFGGRQTYSPLYDAMELFFRDGGSRAYVSRVVGPNPVVATVTLNEAGGSPVGSLVVTAKGPGAYANTLRVTVATVTGGYTLTISDTTLGTLEVSPTLADQASAIAWSQQSSWVNISLGAANANPTAVANAALATGADDRTNVTDTQWRAALTRFTRDLGPGQVTQVGRTSSTAHTDTLAHAIANNRRAVLDLPDSPTPATVSAAALAQRGTNDTVGAAFGPWVVINGLTPNTTRIVPPSALVCARIAAIQSQGRTENAPAAGSPEGASNVVIGLSQPAYDDGSGIDVTRDTMYSNGVNQIVFRYGAYQVFGWRTLVDPNGPSQDWLNFGNSRLAMGIQARALQISESYILDELDGHGRTFSKFAGALTGMLQAYWDAGSLYGTTPEEAYSVDVGPNVNTPTTISNKELHAALSVRMSQDSELVVIEVAKIPVSQSLSV